MNIGLVGVVVAVVGGVLNVLVRKKTVHKVGVGLEVVGYLLLAIYGLQRLHNMHVF